VVSEASTVRHLAAPIATGWSRRLPAGIAPAEDSEPLHGALLLTTPHGPGRNPSRRPAILSPRPLSSHRGLASVTSRKRSRTLPGMVTPCS